MDNKIWLERKQYVDGLIDLRYKTLDQIDCPTDEPIAEESNNTANVELQGLTEDNGRLQAELQKIYNSKGWKLLSLLYRIETYLIPKGSLRYRILRKLYRGLKKIKRGLRFIRSCFLNMNKRNARKLWYALRQGGLVYVLKKVLRYNQNHPDGYTDLYSFQQDETTRKKIQVAILHPTKKQIKEELVFKNDLTPLVSIIMPVYNQWDYTYNCLKSILETSKDCSYEIIIADDGSSDETEHISEQVKNIRYIRNSKNLGFLLNCNNAAEMAKGKYILFLNNDTVVLDNWLLSLVELMERDDSVGLAGSKFIYSDGTLQEAGGIVWYDGAGLNYGRGRNPDHAEYNYVKQVDYISGASIMVRADLWREIGGFDKKYAPAYFEDSDLAFEIRKRGYKVMYQPKSALIHFERTSYGSADSDTFKLMDQNRSKFLEKWGDVLKKDSLASSPENIYIQRDRSKNKETVLFIDDYVPMFDKHAGGKTTFNFLQLILDLGYKITFIGDNEYYPDQPYTGILQQMGIEVIYGPWYRSNQFEWMGQHLQYFDYVFLNRPHIGKKYAKWFVKNSRATVIYYGHDLHFLREYREYELTGDKEMLKQSEEHKRDELEIMNCVDVVLTVSPEEKKIIDRELKSDRSIVTPIFFYKDFDNEPCDSSGKSGLLFVGGFGHTPNVDGAKWFVSEVIPLIKEKIPDIKLTLAGSNPTAEIRNLACEDIEVTGYLSEEELAKLYKKSRVCVIPLRFGAGVKGKTVDAMYHRMAIVSTSIGLEGLDGIEEYLSAYDDPQNFANEVIKLYMDDNSIQDAYKKNINYVKDHLSYQYAIDLFKKIFSKKEKRVMISQRNNYIPTFYGIEDKIVEGRNIQEGYQRGWGIKFGDLVKKVDSDPDFIECYKYTQGRTVVTYERLINIFLLIKFYIPNIIKNYEKTSIIEFGTYKGGSAIFMAALAKRLELPIDVYALDSFEGMPDTDKSVDAHYKGDFKDVNLEEMNLFRVKKGLDNLKFVKGLFQDTANSVLLEAKNIALVHIDCDIYEAVKYSYEVVKPYMINGGYYVFDDATESSCIGATSAVEKFVIRRDGLNSEQIYPHFVFRAFNDSDNT